MRTVDSGISVHRPGRSERARRPRGGPRRGPAAGARCPGAAGGSSFGLVRREQRPRLPFGGVAHGPQPLTIAHADAGLQDVLDAVLFGGRLDEAERALEGGDRVVFEAERQGEMKQHLRVSRALDLREQRRVDGEHQLPPHLVEPGDDAVVDEEPAAVAERVAVRLLDRRARCRAHVREEQRGLDVGGKLAEVGVTPGRRHAVVDARAFARAVPAEPEAVAVGGLGAHPGVQALVDQPVLRLEEELLDQHGLPRPRHPSAHLFLLRSSA